MTSGTTGANTPPEDDDPFGYLYADGQANGAQPPSGGYGYPGSVNRVRAVGQRQYGQPQQQPTAPYGQVPQQGAYGQPNNAHYAAPETFPGGAPTAQHPQQGHGGGGRGRGPNTKGLLIGAIAVVAAVVIGIGVAMLGVTVTTTPPATRPPPRPPPSRAASRARRRAVARPARTTRRRSTRRPCVSGPVCRSPRTSKAPPPPTAAM